MKNYSLLKLNWIIGVMFFLSCDKGESLNSMDNDNICQLGICHNLLVLDKFFSEIDWPEKIKNSELKEKEQYMKEYLHLICKNTDKEKCDFIKDETTDEHIIEFLNNSDCCLYHKYKKLYDEYSDKIEKNDINLYKILYESIIGWSDPASVFKKIYIENAPKTTIDINKLFFEYIAKYIIDENRNDNCKKKFFDIKNDGGAYLKLTDTIFGSNFSVDEVYEICSSFFEYLLYAEESEYRGQSNGSYDVLSSFLRCCLFYNKNIENEEDYRRVLKLNEIIKNVGSKSVDSFGSVVDSEKVRMMNAGLICKNTDKEKCDFIKDETTDEHIIEFLNNSDCCLYHKYKKLYDEYKDEISDNDIKLYNVLYESIIDWSDPASVFKKIYIKNAPKTTIDINKLFFEYIVKYIIDENRNDDCDKKLFDVQNNMEAYTSIVDTIFGSNFSVDEVYEICSSFCEYFVINDVRDISYEHIDKLKKKHLQLPGGKGETTNFSHLDYLSESQNPINRAFIEEYNNKDDSLLNMELVEAIQEAQKDHNAKNLELPKNSNIKSNQFEQYSNLEIYTTEKDLERILPNIYNEDFSLKSKEEIKNYIMKLRESEIKFLECAGILNLQEFLPDKQKN